MTHDLPWGALVISGIREGLQTLAQRMDLSAPGARPWDAYVGLRMIDMKVRLTPETEEPLEFRLSRETTTALVEELATIPQLRDLREALLVALKEEPKHEGRRTERHYRTPVRRSRNFSFQR